jgi:hypothetical protein
MALSDADVRNAHTPRTPEAREQIKDQLENGHGPVETGKAETSLNFEDLSEAKGKKK